MNNKLILSILILVLFFSMGMGGKSPSPGKGDIPKDFTLKDINGKSVTLSSYYGKSVIILAFFTTECPACQEEMPMLQKFYSEYRQKGVEIIGVNLGNSKSSVMDMVKEDGLTFKILLDENGDVGMDYMIRYIPSIMIIDKKGTIAYKGLFTPVEKLRSEADKLIK